MEPTAAHGGAQDGRPADASQNSYGDEISARGVKVSASSVAMLKSWMTRDRSFTMPSPAPFMRLLPASAKFLVIHMLP